MRTPDPNRLLLVAYDFPPEKTAGAYRTAAIARHLDARGWKVTVVTVRCKPETLRGMDSELVPPSVEVIRIPRFHYRDATRSLRHRFLRPSDLADDLGEGMEGSEVPSKRSSWFLRPLRGLDRVLTFPDSRVGWYAPLLCTVGALLLRRRFRIVLSSSPPHSSHLPIRALKRHMSFRWIVDFRDPWTAPPKSVGERMFRLHRRLERSVLMACDAIVANTPGNKKELMRAFPELPEQRITVITNGYDAVLPAGERHEDFDVDFDMVYTGHMYPAMLRKYLRVIDAIRASGRPVPSLGVYGTEPSEDIARLLARGRYDGHVIYKREVSYQQSLDIMRSASVLLLLLPDDPLYETCIPSKLYAYMSAGRRIAALVPDGDAADMIDALGIGTAIRDSEPTAIADKLIRVLSDVDTVGAERHADTRIEEYSWDSLVDRLQGLLLANSSG